MTIASEIILESGNDPEGCSFKEGEVFSVTTDLVDDDGNYIGKNRVWFKCLNAGSAEDVEVEEVGESTVTRK